MRIEYALVLVERLQFPPVELVAWASKGVGEENLGISTGRWCVIISSTPKGPSELTDDLRFLPKKVARDPRCGIGLTIALLLKLRALVIVVPREAAVEESPESPETCLLVAGVDDSDPAFDGVPEREVCFDPGL